MSLPERSSMRMFNSIVFSVMFLFGFLASPGVCETNHPLERFVISESDRKEFTVTREPRYYGPGSLWNYINGGALPYLDYGVRDVVTYMGIWIPDSLEMVVDVYDMADSLGAFGIYSNERSPEYNYLEIGVEGYLTENALCFWKDRYYIKVVSQKDSPPTLAPLERVARIIDMRIPQSGGMSWYFSLFPTRDRLEKTESFIAKNVLGQDFFKNAFVMNYHRKDEDFQLYLIKASSVSEARKNFQAYREFIGKYGKLDKKQVSIGNEAFTGKEDWYGSILFARKGIFILGSVGHSDIDRARNYLKALITDLP